MKKRDSLDLYEEAIEVLKQSDTLRDTVVWQADQTDKLCERYSDAEFDALSMEEREKYLQEVNELYARLQQSTGELKELDKRYQALRAKVKAKYGADIMPPINGDISSQIGPDDEVNLI